MLERRRSERVDSLLDDPEVDQEVGATARRAHRALRSADRRATGRSASSSPTTRTAPTRASPMTTCAWPRRSRRARRSRSTSPSGSPRDALRRVVEAQELERRRLARELHDETGQALTSVLLGLKAVEEARTDEDARRRLAALRELVVDDAAGRPPARRRAAAEGARRLRPRPGTRAAARHVRGADRDRVDLEASSADAAPDRGRDRALPDRAGGADEHRQARAGAHGQHRRSRAATAAITAVIEDDGRGFDAGRRRRTGSGCSACASGSRCSAAG